MARGEASSRQVAGDGGQAGQTADSRQGRRQTGQARQTVRSALEAVAAANRHGQSNSPAASSRAQGVQAGEHDGAGAQSC
jgi:hypothetical protein